MGFLDVNPQKYEDIVKTVAPGFSHSHGSPYSVSSNLSELSF